MVFTLCKFTQLHFEFNRAVHSKEAMNQPNQFKPSNNISRNHKPKLSMKYVRHIPNMQHIGLLRMLVLLILGFRLVYGNGS